MSECRLILLTGRQPFNHGVEGSSPSALTKKFKRLSPKPSLCADRLRLHCTSKSIVQIGDRISNGGSKRPPAQRCSPQAAS
jgi:hypothetical protein